METIYCTLNAKRLTFLGAAGRKASGGETVCYAVAPRPRAVPRPSGKVISLDDYRTPGRPDARPAPPEEAPVPAERPPRPKSTTILLQSGNSPVTKFQWNFKKYPPPRGRSEKILK